ncbi:unnamed protein product [Eruca vesicaria subsp. sativa]|uniref:F-box domain-containing protein n=1 Tax=Eruca vesicaria subsp. sativa TaxID=29727 RepID=A0ABC8KR54_ERUVS|nr:unnamed protein product [Eruca vesicaria subsp. sativa]
MKRIKRSKKRDERNDINDPFIMIPMELKVMILMKLPPRSIARLRFASKHLSSIILGKEFTEMYMTRSSSQPRHLVSVHRGSDMQLFHSFSQEEHSNDHDKVSYTLDPDVRLIFIVIFSLLDEVAKYIDVDKFGKAYKCSFFSFHLM